MCTYLGFFDSCYLTTIVTVIFVSLKKSSKQVKITVASLASYIVLFKGKLHSHNYDFLRNQLGARTQSLVLTKLEHEMLTGVHKLKVKICTYFPLPTFYVVRVYT